MKPLKDMFSFVSRGATADVLLVEKGFVERLGEVGVGAEHTNNDQSVDTIDKLIAALKADFSDRNGLGWDDLPDDAQKEIHADWRAIIERFVLPAGEEPKPDVPEWVREIADIISGRT